MKTEANSGNDTRKQFCPRCDTVMFDHSKGFPQLLGVMASQIAPSYIFTPACHVFVRDKKPGLVIPEGIKKYEKGLV